MNKFWAGKCFRKVFFTCESVAWGPWGDGVTSAALDLYGNSRMSRVLQMLPYSGSTVDWTFLVSSGQLLDLEQAYPTLVMNKYLIFLPKVRPELDVTLKGNKFVYSLFTWQLTLNLPSQPHKSSMILANRILGYYLGIKSLSFLVILAPRASFSRWQVADLK